VRLAALLCAVSCGLQLAACAGSRQYFEPLERVHGQTVYGYKQALYPLQAPSGALGEATLWSRGAYPTHDGRTVIHVAFSLHNTSAAPIRLDPRDVRIDAARTADGFVQDVPAAEREVLTVAPQAIGQLVLHFVMPDRVSPTEIDAFTLSWAVRAGAQAYAQRTAFAERAERVARDEPYYDRYPCWPYGPYDCMWGPPWPPMPPPIVIHERDFGRRDRAVVRPRR